MFGEHVQNLSNQNLSNTEAKDFARGPHEIDGISNRFRENEMHEVLTLVTYVAKVRLSDGTVVPACRTRTTRILTVISAVVTMIVVVHLTVLTLISAGMPFLGGRERPTEQATSSLKDAGSTDEQAIVTRKDGGSITTPLGYGIAIARNSSLKIEWIAVHHPSMPVNFDGTPGVTTRYVRKEYSGGYRYESKFRIIVKQPIRAVEVRFLTFDVWGDHVRTLSFEEVADCPTGTREFTGQWQVYSENEIESHYASIGYIARVRLADGRVVSAPTDTVIKEAQKFSQRFTATELEPKPTPSPNSGI